VFLGLDFAARSDVGLVRGNNQDSAFAGPNLLVVADGMGGAAGGDIASSIAVGTLAGLDGEELGQEEALDALKEAIARAHAQIVERAHNDPQLSGLGTTVTALLRSGHALAMAHIGDSRAYLLRDGALDQVTTDHSFVQHLVDTGRLSAADAENHPKRSMLLRVLGDVDSEVPVDISARETKAGDRWLLCTDGLSSVVGRATLAKTMAATSTPAECADRLVALALAGGAPDNVTCIVADVVDLDRTSAKARPRDVSQVVGSAAAARSDAPAAREQAKDTSAARAAALSDDVAGDMAGDMADDAPRRRVVQTWERLRPWALPLIGFLVLFAGAFGAYSWTQTQYYVADFDGDVSIFRGIPQSIGPFALSTLVSNTGISLDELEPFEQDRVRSAIRRGSLSDAWDVVDDLEGSA
jgi:protein phosphatase